MTDTLHCPACGAERPAGAQPDAPCPTCLLKLGLREVLDAQTGEPPASQRDVAGERSTVQRPGGAGDEASLPGFIGPYQLLSVLGEGGFGIVYLAQQQEPLRRRVALKVIKLGMDSREVIARFETEQHALALMSHPNIAKVLDAGTTDRGTPYFVMEHVPGVPITDYCDGNRLGIRERLELFIPICQAVHHAHQKGVIHRDLKPSNVLVAVEDGQARPKVIDFGIAKAIDQRHAERSLFTERGVIVGTPAYMSPEQADASGQEVDTSTDVYSLGVLLYELLSGVLPFAPARLHGVAYAEMLRIIREEDAPSLPSRFDSLGKGVASVAGLRRQDSRGLLKELRGDLDWITRRAIEKDRTRRYASASELAADIARHLAGEPIDAKRHSAWYVLSKTLRRYRGRVALAGALLVVVVASAVITSGLALRLKRQRDRAEAAEREARVAVEQAESQAYRTALAGAQVAFASLDPGKASQLLDEAPEARRGWEWNHLSLRADSSLAVIQGQGTPIVDVTWSADGHHLWWLAHPFDAIWEIELGADALPVAGAAPRVAWKEEGEGVIAFTSDGTRVATATPRARGFGGAPHEDDEEMVTARATVGDDLLHPGEAECTLSIWDRASHRRVATTAWPKCGTWTGRVPHSATPPGPWGRGRFTFAGKEWMEIVDGNFQPVLRLGGRFPQLLRGRFSADGRQLAAWSWQGGVRRLDAATLERRGEMEDDAGGSRGDIADVAWWPNGDLAVVWWDGVACRQRDQATTAFALQVMGKRVTTGAVALLPSDDAMSMAYLGDDTGGATWVQWTSERMDAVNIVSERGATRVHAAAITAMTYVRPLETLVTGSDDGTLALSSLDGVVTRLLGHAGSVTSVATTPSGSRLASGSADGTLRLWGRDDRSRLRLESSEGLRFVLGFDADSSRLCSVSYGDGTLACWELQGGDPHARTWLAPPWTDDLHDTRAATSLAVLESGDHPLLRVASDEGWVDIRGWGDSRAEIVASHDIPDPHHGERRCVVAPNGSVVHVAPDGVHVTTVAGTDVPCDDSTATGSVGWSDDGAFVVGWMPENRIVAWDASSGRIAWSRRVEAPIDPPEMLAASRRARIVATINGDESGVLWIADGDVLRAAHRFPGWGVAFAPDDRRIAVSLNSGAIRILDGASLRPIVEMPMEDSLGPLAWSPDGKRLAVLGTREGIVVLDAVRR